MATYKLTTIRPPDISLQFHTFQFRVSQQELGEDGPWFKPIGTITFQKPAAESWQQARARFTPAVYAWLTTYETAQAINTAISAWLQTQEWHTPPEP